MKKKILLICPSAGRLTKTPCGRDAYKLAKYLVDNFDISVEILSSIKPNTEDCSSDLKIIYVPTYKELFQESYEKYSTMHGAMKILYGLKYMYNKKKYERNSFAHYVMSKERLKKWIKTFNSNEYDLIISISHPFYVHKYADLLTKHLEINQWCAWFLDPYSDNYNLSSSLKDVKKRIIEENRIFKNCTSIFATYEMVNRCKNSQIANYLDKVVVAPTHLMEDNCTTISSETVNDEKIKCVFTGTFLPSIRDPHLLLNYFDKLPPNFYLYLYSRFCVDAINLHKNILGKRLVINDFILDKVEFDRMIHSMDILIDIGNTLDNMVPSKVLNYLSYGKPILHFSNCKNDPVKRILENYSLSLSLPYNESINTREIVKFCEDMKGKTLLWKEVESSFFSCTLHYVANKVYEMVK